MFSALPQQTDSFEDDRRFRVGPTAEKLATRMGNHSAAGISRKRTCFIDFGRSACWSPSVTEEYDHARQRDPSHTQTHSLEPGEPGRVKATASATGRLL